LFIPPVNRAASPADTTWTVNTLIVITTAKGMTAGRFLEAERKHDDYDAEFGKLADELIAGAEERQC
jgi:hypothetical protein